MELPYLDSIGLLRVGNPANSSSRTRSQIPSQSRASTSVFICAGQSNMVGRGRPADLPREVIGTAASCSLSYDHDRNFAEKFNQLHRAVKTWTPLRPDAQYSYGGECEHFGPEFGIANYLVEPVYFIKFGMGSTNLHTDWKPDGKYFKEFVAFVKAALASAPQPAEIKALFWMQGESDSTGNAQQVNAYESNLVAFVEAVRQELGHIPFVASQVDYHNEGSSKRPKKLPRVNQAIANVCARDDMQPARCSPLAGETSTWEDGHLDSAALLEVGANMGAAYRALQASLKA